MAQHKVEFGVKPLGESRLGNRLASHLVAEVGGTVGDVIGGDGRKEPRTVAKLQQIRSARREIHAPPISCPAVAQETDV